MWLLNCEDLDLTITGDHTYGRDFARYLAAELACNPWSHGVRVDCVGVAEEVAAMNPDRIRAYPSQPDAGKPDPAAAALADAVTTVDRCAEVGTDTATARAAQAGADTWPARLLLVDAAATDRTPALDQLLTLVDQHAGQTGTSVVVRGPRDTAPGVELHVTAAGRVTLPHAGLDLVAVGLTSDEAHGCAALLAASENLDDVAMPVDPDAADGWRAFSDQPGPCARSTPCPGTRLRGRPDVRARARRRGLPSPRRHHRRGPRRARPARARPGPCRGRAGRPHPRRRRRRLVRRRLPAAPADPARPRHARTRGTPVTKRKPYFTEMLAYLATRPHGATPEELAAAFGITAAKSRDYVTIVRDWLGTNPRTGEKHLPDARQAPAAKARGIGVYQVIDLLVRRRPVPPPPGARRGPRPRRHPRPAHRTAARTGPPVRQTPRRRLVLAVRRGPARPAHDLRHRRRRPPRHHPRLQAGDLTQARLAAETAPLAAPDEEIPRLDLAAVAAAEGHHGEAERILRDEVSNRTDDDGAPPELPDRTQRIIAARGWLPRDQEVS